MFIHYSRFDPFFFFMVFRIIHFFPFLVKLLSRLPACRAVLTCRSRRRRLKLLEDPAQRRRAEAGRSLETDPELRTEPTAAGFEGGVDRLNHDGKLYSSRAEFDRRAERINRYLKEWGAVGFRSPAMHHNLEWLKALNIEYDASTFDTDPFEPQPDGVGTIFPFWVAREDGTGYVEIPYTLPQDHLLFVLMKEKSIDIWKKKLDWIAEKGGMALINTHPDYMHFGDGKPGLEEYPVRLFAQFLEYVKDRYEGRYWHALPREVARFWREQQFC